MRVVRRADCPVQPWKNGGGVSRLIAASPDGAGYDALDWHVSRPSIAASGPFSHLPGLDRQFMTVAPAGVALHVHGDGAAFTQRVDRPLAPFAFRGDWDVHCELLDGPAEVLNVMTRRGAFGARIEVVDLGATPALLRTVAGEVLIAYCPEGQVSAYGSWGTATLERDDAVVADDASATELALKAGDDAPIPVVIIRVGRP
jgi:hypothetical protein